MPREESQDFVLRPESGAAKPLELALAADGTFSVKAPGRKSAQLKLLRRETNGLLTVLWGDRVISGAVSRADGATRLLCLSAGGRVYRLRLREAALDAMEQSLSTGARGDGVISVSSPIPGLIKALAVKRGDAAKAGQTLVVLEAMKMENEIPAPHDGVVESIEVRIGQSVAAGALLIRIKL